MASPPPGFDLYSAVGGLDTCRKLSAAFYGRVAQDNLLRSLFPGKSFRCAIEAFSAFLVQFLGGPPGDGERHWWLSLRESHLRFKIGQKERDAWMRNMIAALDDIHLAEPPRSALLEFFERSSSCLVNCGQGSAPSESRNPPAGDHPLHREMESRWNIQQTLDEAVAAIRSGDGHRAIALAESCTLRTGFERDRRIFVGMLALMSGGNMELRDYVRGKLLADPALARERYSGRTLLHWASAAGNLELVELLLRLGADPNATSGGGRTPLYCVANECGIPTGGSVVRALVESGASVNATDNLKRCTALHMAARRGNVQVAQALLDCGADIEALDSRGDTPLRRAVNCRKTVLAAFLLSRGADKHSKGSKPVSVPVDM